MRYPPLRYYLKRIWRDMGGYLSLGRGCHLSFLRPKLGRFASKATLRFKGKVSKFRRNPHTHKIKIGTSTPPPFQKNPRPPPPLWAWGFSSRKNTKMPGAHKIGAAVSGPRIVGGKFMDMRLFLKIRPQDTINLEKERQKDNRESANRALAIVF